jgi:hypothetical protein
MLFYHLRHLVLASTLRTHIVKTLNHHLFSTLLASMVLSATLSACGGSEEQKVYISKGLPESVDEPLIRSEPGSAVRAVEQLRAAGVNVADYKCSEASNPMGGFAGNPPIYVLLEIDAQQLSIATIVGFNEVNNVNLQNTFDCASRSL